jgi:heme-degrading monooxygenase HmoA
MLKGLGRLLGMCLIGLLWLLPSAPAAAEKVAEPMVFDSNAIAVVSLYETNPTTQAEAVKSFYKLTKSFYKTIPGFYGLAFFSSDDGARVVEFSQWKDQSSYEAFQASLTSGAADKDYTKYYEQYASAKGGKEKGKGKGKEEDVSLGEPLFTASFVVDQVVSPPGMVAAIPSSAALVQISEIATDTPEHQADLLAAAQETLSNLPQLYPSPRTTVLLKGIDTNHIALLSNWGSAAEFSDLTQVPQIALKVPVAGANAEEESGASEIAFTTDSHLYQTIKVITPKAAKYGKG